MHSTFSDDQLHYKNLQIWKYKPVFASKERKFFWNLQMDALSTTDGKHEVNPASFNPSTPLLCGLSAVRSGGSSTYLWGNVDIFPGMFNTYVLPSPPQLKLKPLLWINYRSVPFIFTLAPNRGPNFFNSRRCNRVIECLRSWGEVCSQRNVLMGAIFMFGLLMEKWSFFGNLEKDRASW